MDKKKRPLSREKHVTEGSGSARRRGSGLHSQGPVGGDHGYSDRNGQESGDRGFLDDALGGAGSSGMEHMVENLIVNEAAQALSGRKKGGRRIPLLLIAVVVVFILGGGLKFLTSGLGSTGLSSSHDLLNSYSGGYGGAGGLDTGSQGGWDWNGGGNDSNAGVLNTSVSKSARPKRTSIAGNGRDVVTIMVYMCGTDLESKYGMATSDLQEMAKAQIGDQVNLLVYTGGCPAWKNNVVSNDVNQIYQIKDGSFVKLGDAQAKPMTDPDTLSGYIRWGKKKFPADRYELIFWDHGGGSISGYGYDQKYANAGSMTLDKISTALEDGGCTFDFIGFDACLMATLETSLVVEPYADYLIGSEETEPGVGWYYTNWLTKLSQDTSMSTLEIGKNIADDFVSVCSQKTPRDQTTLSVIDLAELKGTVPEKFKDFAKATTGLIRNDNYQTVSNARSRSKEFAKSVGIDQVDLVNLADNLDTKESRALAEALRSAVKYNCTSSNVQNAYGISIYFPYGKLSSVNQMANTYSKIGLDTSYTNCIKSFASLEAGGQAAAGGNSGQLSSLFGNLLSGSGSLLSGSGSSSSGGAGGSSELVAQLLGSLLQNRNLPNLGLDEESARFLDKETLEGSQEYLTDNCFRPEDLLWQDKGDGQVIKLPEEQWDLIQDVELNVFVDDGEGYIDLGLDNVFSFDDDGDLEGGYDRTWLAVNGQIVAYYMLSAEGDGDSYKITGRVPVLLNGQQADLILVFTDDTPQGEAAGARIRYDASETETQAKGLIPVEPGDTLDFLCDYYTYDQDYQDSYYLGEQLQVADGLEISNISLDSEEFLASYRLTDIYNNHYWTPQIP